jgi:2-keto-4-pentenoate hydratase
MEIYHSNLEETARTGLLNLMAEALQTGDGVISGVALEKLKELDRKQCKEKLDQLRVEVNNIVSDGAYEGVKTLELGC